MKTLGIVILSLVIIIASLVFLLFSYCAVMPSGSHGGGDISMTGQYREAAIEIALVSSAIIAAGTWAIVKLNRKRRR